MKGSLSCGKTRSYRTFVTVLAEDKHLQKQLKEGRQCIKAGKAQWQEHKVFCLVTPSTVRKNRVMNAGAELAFSSPCSAGPQPVDSQCCPPSGWVLSPQFNLYRNSIMDTPRDVFPW